MKRFLAVLAFAAVAGAMYVAAAPGGRATSPTPKQYKALKKQVNVLSKQLAALKKDEAGVKSLALAEAGAIIDCIAKEVPINEFGDAQGKTYGYAYTDSSQTPGFSTALDLTSSSDPNATWIPTSDSTCVSEVNAAGLKHFPALAHAR